MNPTSLLFVACNLAGCRDTTEPPGNSPEPTTPPSETGSHTADTAALQTTADTGSTSSTAHTGGAGNTGHTGATTSWTLAEAGQSASENAMSTWVSMGGAPP